MTDAQKSKSQDYDKELEEIRKLWKESNTLQSDVIDCMNAQHEVTETIIAKSTSITNEEGNAK